MITYEDHLRHMQAHYGNASEGGGGTGAVDEATWNAMSTEEKFNNVQGGFGVGPDDPRYEDLAEQTGAEEGRPVWVTQPVPEDRLTTQWFTDPGRVVNGEGWSAFAENNRSPYSQEQDEAGGLSQAQWNAIAIAFVTAGAGAAYAGGGAAVSGGELAAAGGQGFGTAVGSTGSGYGIGGAVGGAAAPGATAGTGTTPGLGGEGSPGWTAEGGPPVQPAPTPTPTPAPSIGNGIINGARGAWNSATQWYSGLSPLSRQVLGLGVSQGISGALRANAQNEASGAATAREERQRDDRVRRTGVGNFGSAFTPKPKGIIDSRRSGG